MNDESNQPAPGEAQPTAARTAAPICLIGLLGLLVFFGIFNLENHAGAFEETVYLPYHDALAVSDDTYHDPVVESQIRGQVLFGKNCSACHQNSGLGVPGQFPPLVNSDWVNFKTPNRIVRAVMRGFHGPLVLNGQPFNTAAIMTPFGETLSDQDIADILTFVRGNKEWSNHASVVCPDLVKAIRAKIADHPQNFTPDELLKVGEND